MGFLRVCVVVVLAGFSQGSPEQPHYVTRKMADSGKSSTDYFLQQTAFTHGSDSHSHVNGHLVKVYNPSGRFSIVQPQPGGCGTIEMVKDTATRYSPQCDIATDGAYYTLHEAPDFKCIGNQVSDGAIVQTAPYNTSNVNFGIKNGEWIIGYITPEEVNAGGYEQLIEGLGWIVHEGKNYVDKGWKEAYTAAGSSGDKYASMTSGRTAVGWDKEGNLVIWQVDGHSNAPSWGATMYELADKLVEFGVVEAINMDGGGSTQMVHKGVEIGYSSDRTTWGVLSKYYDPNCPMGNGPDNLGRFECTRMVSSILCVHEKPGLRWPSWGTPALLTVLAACICFGVGFMIGGKGKVRELGLGLKDNGDDETGSE